MIPPQSFVDVRRCWPEVSPQVGPLAVPSKRRLDQRHHRLMAASLQAKTFWASPLYRDVGRRRAASVLVVSTAFVRAALGGGGLEISLNSIGILTAMHNVIPRAYARFVQSHSARERLFTDAMPRNLWTIRPPMHCGTALMLTIVEVVGRLGISNSDANQWALDNEGHRRKELRFMLDLPVQRLVVVTVGVRDVPKAPPSASCSNAGSRICQDPGATRAKWRVKFLSALFKACPQFSSLRLLLKDGHFFIEFFAVKVGHVPAELEDSKGFVVVA